MAIATGNTAGCEAWTLLSRESAVLATDDDKEREEITRWLAELRVEHRDLDEVIEYLEQTGHPDRMKVRRMKKRKLKLKDTISRLESQLIPDLDA